MFNLSLISLIPLFVVIAFEIVYRGSFIDTLSWISTYPKHFFLNYILMFGLINIFYWLPRKLYILVAAISLSVLSIIGYISRQKLDLRGEPLLPWDFILGKEALNITQQSPKLTLDLPLIAVLVVALSFLILLRFVPREDYRISKKLVAVILASAIFISVYTEYVPLQKTFSLRLINWSQKMNYEENGMLLGFVLNTGYLAVDKPENYKQETVKALVKETKPLYPVDPNFKPNIIFVMSEAFWDPTLLKEVSFNEDPLPFFHSLQKSYTSGTMLSPVYGGGTANTEFEVLTGFSTQFLPRGMIPYVQYVHKPLEALPSILKRQGYETTAVHTYHNWFYRRNNVYQDLGFDKFISKEFFNEPEYSGQYIRDTELSKKILEEIKLSDKPDFVYAVSMQAHGPYSKEANPNNTITASGNLSPESKAVLENYTQTISDVDQSLKLLIEGLEETGEPTIVVFFGDHLPMLGTSYDVYKEANFFRDESTYEDYLKMYSVPFVVWDNFSSKTAKDQHLRLSSSFLSPYILERTKKEGSMLTDFLYALSKKGKKVVVGEQHQNKESLSAKDLERYRLLQYDFLIGSEYAYLMKPKLKPALNPNYVLGDGRTVIENATPPDSSTIAIQGENFQINHTVYVNGQPVKTLYTNDNNITASLPRRLKSKPGLLEIQVKLTDSMGNVISESNTFELKTS